MWPQEQQNHSSNLSNPRPRSAPWFPHTWRLIFKTSQPILTDMYFSIHPLLPTSLMSTAIWAICHLDRCHSLWALLFAPPFAPLYSILDKQPWWFVTLITPLIRFLIHLVIAFRMTPNSSPQQTRSCVVGNLSPLWPCPLQLFSMFTNLQPHWPSFLPSNTATSFLSQGTWVSTCHSLCPIHFAPESWSSHPHFIHLTSGVTSGKPSLATHLNLPPPPRTHRIAHCHITSFYCTYSNYYYLKSPCACLPLFAYLSILLK